MPTEHDHQWTITRRYTKNGTRWEVRCRGRGCQAHMKIDLRGRHFRVTPPQIADAIFLFTEPRLAPPAAHAGEREREE